MGASARHQCLSRFRPSLKHQHLEADSFHFFSRLVNYSCGHWPLWRIHLVVVSSSSSSRSRSLSLSLSLSRFPAFSRIGDYTEKKKKKKSTLTRLTLLRPAGENSHLFIEQSSLSLIFFVSFGSFYHHGLRCSRFLLMLPSDPSYFLRPKRALFARQKHTARVKDGQGKSRLIKVALTGRCRAAVKYPFNGFPVLFPSLRAIRRRVHQLADQNSR